MIRTRYSETGQDGIIHPMFSLEDITVRVAVSSFSKARFCLAYQILREKTFIARANVMHCFLNESLN